MLQLTLKKSRKKLKDKCRKITKQQNNSKATNKSDNSDAKVHEIQGNISEIRIEPTDFLNKIMSEIDVNFKIAHLLYI